MMQHSGYNKRALFLKVLFKSLRVVLVKPFQAIFDWFELDVLIVHNTTITTISPRKSEHQDRPTKLVSTPQKRGF